MTCLCLPHLTFQVAGVSGKPVAFLLTDSQMADPAFLGDVNSLLNTGEITGDHKHADGPCMTSSGS
jgi:hypothetical protein